VKAFTAFIQNKPILFWGSLFALSQGIAVAFEMYFLFVLPAALFALWLAIHKIEWVWFFSVMATPLSINLEEMEVAHIGMYLPTEPIIAALLLLMIFKILSGKSVDRRIFKHPFTYIIGLYLLWMVFTAVTSEYPLVSFKFIATRLWFISGFYLLGAHLFQDFSNIKKFFAYYLAPLCLVIIYTVSRHAQFNFDKESAHWVMEPLFKDHTSYGAVLAMFFPISVGLLFVKKKSPLITFLIYAVLLILTIGLILSYTRAAWVSVVVAAALCVLMLLRVPLKYILYGSLLGGAILLFSWNNIQQELGQNKQESSDKLDEHVSSISNVSSDASNLERLNRWNCAMEMFRRRPIMGWGPGTYQFVYAPFQQAKDRTIISTNNGDGGNAHSEYLGPLAEQGVPGMLLFLSIFIYTVILSFKLFYTAKDKEHKIIILSVFLGLLTYFVHGTLNNYLDTDKASVPFWGFIGILVAMDLFHLRKKEEAVTSKALQE
jgi:O-antigen ligase